MNQPDYRGEDPGPNRQFKAGQRRRVRQDANTEPYLNPGDIVTLLPLEYGDNNMLYPEDSDWLVRDESDQVFGDGMWYIDERFLSEEEVTDESA